MDVAQVIILLMIATPLAILARDAFNRRHEPAKLWLALAVVGAILINVVVTVSLGK